MNSLAFMLGWAVIYAFILLGSAGLLFLVADALVRLISRQYMGWKVLTGLARHGRKYFKALQAENASLQQRAKELEEWEDKLLSRESANGKS